MQVTEATESTAIAEFKGDDKASSMAMMLNQEHMNSAMSLAKIMASSTVTVPKHLQKQEGDCMAIILQAMNWGMNPFAVAQKTHIVNGTLGYEAQLVNAVVQSQGFIDGTFHYEYQGEGENLQCRVGAVVKGQQNITWGEWLKFSAVTIKNSPLWKTNPKQQMGYLQVKNWTRLYFPAAILGVYTDDELAVIPSPAPVEKDITAQGSVEVTYLSNEEFASFEPDWKNKWIRGAKLGMTIDQFKNWAADKSGKHLTLEQIAIVEQVWNAEQNPAQGTSTIS